MNEFPLPPGAPPPLPAMERKSIFIPRDYTRGLTVAWSTDFPTDLVRVVDERQWIGFIKGLNERFAVAEKVTSRSVFETCMGLLTCYIVHPCMRSQYDVHLDDIADFIDEFNETACLPRGIHIGNPMEHGLRSLEIVFLYVAREKKPADTQPSSGLCILPRI